MLISDETIFQNGVEISRYPKSTSLGMDDEIVAVTGFSFGSHCACALVGWGINNYGTKTQWFAQRLHQVILYYLLCKMVYRPTLVLVREYVRAILCAVTTERCA